MTYDAIIIGGGHNGLVCGAYLAKAGLKVKVLERRPIVGGAAVTEEFHPGFRASTFSYLMSLLHPRVIADLELRRHGLEVLPCSDMFAPLEGGDYIVFSDNLEKTQRQFARFNKRDAERYAQFDRFIGEAATVVRALLFETPPDPARRDWRTYKRLASFAWRYRKIGGRMYRIVDLLTMSADDFLKRWFEDSRIRAVLAYYASIGTFVGPKSPGSAYVIMHHIMGEHEGAGGWGFIKGGMGAITQAIAAYGQTVGMEIETDSPIAEVRIRDGKAHGVITEDGRPYKAKVVISNASVKALFLGMIDRRHLSSGLPVRCAQLPNLLDRLQAQRGRRAPAAIYRPGEGARGWRARQLALSDLLPHRPGYRLSGKGLRRCEIRLVFVVTVHHAGDAERGRRLPGARRQAHDQSVRRACAL